MTEPLLTPISIGSCRLKNRLILTAASLCRCPDGVTDPQTVDFYKARAKGGTGLLIAGAAGIDPHRRSQTGMMQICDDSFLPGLRRLTEEVHRLDSKIFLQLLHPGAYASPAEYGGAEPVAPSAYVSRLTGAQTAAMTLPQIQEMVKLFAQGAVRARKAGFDGVELCASVGYLIAEFLSPATNQRTDDYGGPLENRMRFLLEIVDAVKKAAGDDFAFMVRLSGADLIPNGNSIEDVVLIGKALEQHGVHALSVTGGWHESRIPQITTHVPHGAYRFYARALKQAVSIPVAACNRMDLTSGRKALLAEDCDLVGMCRPLLADPTLVEKLQQNRTDEITRCLSCNQECLDRVFAGKAVGCTVNPRIGHETQPTVCREHRKNILVIGAGISGLVYAGAAAVENHVTVWEQSGHFGGAARVLSRLPGWHDVQAYVDSLHQTCIRQNVTFRWRQTAAPDHLQSLLENGTYDKIIIASGAELRVPDFPVADGATVCTMQEFLEKDYPLAPHTVILGNDFRAFEFAMFCAEKSSTPAPEASFYGEWFPPFPPPQSAFEKPSVTCLGPHRKPGSGMAKSVLWAALKHAKYLGLNLVSEATVQRVSHSEIVFEQNGTLQSIPAGLVILAHGWNASPWAAEIAGWPAALQTRVEVIGDAKAPARITQAVQSAFAAVLPPELSRKETSS